MHPLEQISYASFGAFCQEIVHLYQWSKALNRNNSQSENRGQIKLYDNWRCWLITILMIVCSGIAVFILYDDKELPKNALFLLGASFPALFKKLRSAVTNNDLDLGESTWQKYFQT